MQGPGVYKYANGHQFMGTFLKNKFHGEAIVSFKSTAEIQYNYYEIAPSLRHWILKTMQLLRVV